MSDPANVFDESARLADEALVRARAELAEVNQRTAELEALIAQAEA